MVLDSVIFFLGTIAQNIKHNIPQVSFVLGGFYGSYTLGSQSTSSLISNNQQLFGEMMREQDNSLFKGWVFFVCFCRSIKLS